MANEPGEVRVQVPLEVLLTLEEPSTARVHRVPPHTAEVVAQVRDRVELCVAVLASQCVNHVRGEPMTRAQDVCRTLA